MEILPGIHRFHAPLEGLELREINIYLLRGTNGSVLIDTGWDAPGVWDGLMAQFESDHVKVTEISDVIVTHTHSDHYGLAARFKEASGARIIMHPAETRLIGHLFDTSESQLAMGIDFLGRHGIEETYENLKKMLRSFVGWVSGFVPPDREVKDGDSIDAASSTLEVISTPGHSPGHICLYDVKRRLFFSGDHVLPHITPNIGTHPQNSDNPLGNFMSSLGRVRNLPVDTVFPAHGESFQDLKLRVDELLQHHEERMAEIMDALACSPQSAFEIAGKVVWLKDFGGRPLSGLSHIDQKLAVGETISHLEFLCGEGQVCKIGDSGQIRYQVVTERAGAFGPATQPSKK